MRRVDGDLQKKAKKRISLAAGGGQHPYCPQGSLKIIY
jgi:hypothetical protein